MPLLGTQRHVPSRQAAWVSPAVRLVQNADEMSPSTKSRRQPAGQDPGRTARPKTGARSMRTGSLLMLVGVDLIVAVLMVVSFVEFVLKPDPAVKAGPMYVTLTLTTGAALLMFAMALNASFLPFVSRQRAANVQLVMWAMGVTGIVTGLLTIGRQASPFATRLVLGGIAFAFITVQNARLVRARAAAPAEQTEPAAPKARPHTGSRQRRGGRKR